MTRCRCKWTLLLVMPLLAVVRADDWPQWRGPNRDGVVSNSAGPASWPEQLKLRWKIAVGEGHSSPILAGKSIYIFTRQHDSEFVSAIDLETGKIIWQQSYPALTQ